MNKMEEVTYFSTEESQKETVGLEGFLEGAEFFHFDNFVLPISEDLRDAFPEFPLLEFNENLPFEDSNSSPVDPIDPIGTAGEDISKSLLDRFDGSSEEIREISVKQTFVMPEKFDPDSLVVEWSNGRGQSCNHPKCAGRAFLKLFPGNTSLQFLCSVHHTRGRPLQNDQRWLVTLHWRETETGWPNRLAFHLTGSRSLDRRQRRAEKASHS